MEYAPYLAVLLLIVGLALLMAEIFIPSGGVILVLALVCIAGSIWSAWNAWWHSHPYYFWFYIGSVVLLFPAALGGALYGLQKTRFGRRILLDAPSLEEVTPYAAEQQHLSQLIGKTGKTLTLLGPGGLVLVEGERMHCESPGMLIDPGEEVEVVAVKGNRLVVRPATDRSKPADAFLEESDDSDKPPLDFDLPQS